MTVHYEHPPIIQGGMGVSVSNWRLANAVASAGQLGVVSGTFIDGVLARRLQDGDADGAVRRALAAFPVPAIAEEIISQYFIEGGKPSNQPYRPVPMHSLKSRKSLVDLTVAANFAEVFLAKEGHKGAVGINYLTKIELPTLPSLFGAMLAGVDYVLMGAGIPKSIPGILDRLAQLLPVSLKIDVIGAGPEDHFETSFDPSPYLPAGAELLKRPFFLAIVSSSTLAQSLAKKASGRVDGFVVEHHTAGGHNAPPRGALCLDQNGEPVYGSRDEVELSEFRKLGLPFWVAGSSASAGRLKEALSAGAQGVQVGTAFAYCNESGIIKEIKRAVIERALEEADVFTDPRASASGYPFKVVQLPGTVSEEDVYLSRERICDLGYLRSAYKLPCGGVGFRCPAEPVDDYVKKGGSVEETIGRKCLCNGLMATIGQPQVRDDGHVEPPLVTAGKNMACIADFVKPNEVSYTAAHVIEVLKAGMEESVLSALSEKGNGCASSDPLLS